MSDYILETKNLSFTYPDGTKALNNINLKIKRGKKVAFVGVNGSGKSTLFLNFNGVLKPTEGNVIFEGKELEYDKSSLMNIRKNIGIVFQNPETMLFASNVYQEVSFGPMNLKLPENEVKIRVDKALEDVNMTPFKDKSIHFLSYGQKKRVSIADILSMEPKLIVFDEPTSSLDPKHSEDIMNVFDQINKNNITIVLSTHDVDLAYSYADYVIVLKDGSIETEGIPEEVFSNQEIIKRCCLKKPYVLDFYENLKEKNMLIEHSEIPKNKESLYKIIK